eukprot:TRINITY_DN11974_c2_g2_i1.p1 TRINITY_DN11974_c2_g2~~TRINITY_DN11974_c2_g2_i1.p1  ORF type:complete len:205 (+),score=42.47 TRINITY_DN11974_c2_g2_i1:23-616(+)
MGSSQSKKRQQQQVIKEVEVESKHAKNLRRATEKAVYNRYKNEDGLWCFEEYKKYAKEAEKRDPQWEDWVRARGKSPARNTAPYSAVGEETFEIFAKDAELDTSLFVENILVKQLSKTEMRLQASKERIAGMAAAMKKSGLRNTPQMHPSTAKRRRDFVTNHINTVVSHSDFSSLPETSSNPEEADQFIPSEPMRRI